jgi:hypothetical protein
MTNISRTKCQLPALATTATKKSPTDPPLHAAGEQRTPYTGPPLHAAVEQRTPYTDPPDSLDSAFSVKYVARLLDGMSDYDSWK